MLLHRNPGPFVPCRGCLATDQLDRKARDAARLCGYNFFQDKMTLPVVAPADSQVCPGGLDYQ